MQEETEYLNKQNNARMWTISLAVSILCCTIFSAVAYYCMSTLGKSLDSIDGRLASIETRSLVGAALPDLPPSAAAIPVPEPPKPSAAAPLAPEPASATVQDTVPSAPPPSNEEPPAKSSPQMSTPSESEDVFVPAPSPEPSALP